MMMYSDIRYQRLQKRDVNVFPTIVYAESNVYWTVHHCNS